MSDINKVIIVGNLTNDPELRHTQSGASICSFSIACNSTYKTKDGEVKKSVHFFKCNGWGKLAETICQYQKKGNRVCIDGSLQQTSWDGPAGEKKYSVEIKIDNIQFLTPKTGKDQPSEYTGEDIPF